MRILVLDDDAHRHVIFAERFAEHSVKHVSDPWQALDCMKAERFDLVQLDHDLSFFEFNPYKMEVTGTEVATGMVAMLPVEDRPALTVVHSWNPDGGKRMFNILFEAGFNVVFEPFDNPTGCLVTLADIAEFQAKHKNLNLVG